MGDSTLHVSRIHHLVPVDTPMIEFHHQFQPEVVERIARYIAGIIDDGSTLQIGLGRIPNEALKYLDDRKDLGIHSDVITDAIIPLLERGILTGRNKSQQRGKIVTSFAMGTRKLYDIIERNPLFSFQPIDVVCDPFTIAAHKQMVSVTQAFAIDQQPYLQSYLAVSLLASAIDFGTSLPTFPVLTGPGIVDASNIDATLAGVKLGAR